MAKQNALAEGDSIAASRLLLASVHSLKVTPSPEEDKASGMDLGGESGPGPIPVLANLVGFVRAGKYVAPLEQG